MKVSDGLGPNSVIGIIPETLVPVEVHGEFLHVDRVPKHLGNSQVQNSSVKCTWRIAEDRFFYCVI